MPVRSARWRSASGALLTSLVLVVALLTTACGNDPNQAQARRDRAQLDAELVHAQQLGLPDSMLQPILAGERKAAQGEGGWGYSYQNAAASYASLYAQLVKIEAGSHDYLMTQATRNLSTFSALVNARKADGFIEVAAFQQRLDATRQQLTAAHTPDDIAAVSRTALAQSQALSAMTPTYEQMQALKSAIQSMQRAGIPAPWAGPALTQDLAAFRAAASPEDFTRLQHQLRSQTAQLTADTAQAGPYVAQSVLNTMQAQIAQLRANGEQADAFQRSHDSDAAALSAAHTPTDYLTLLNTIVTQQDQMAVPLARGKARADIQTLKTLVQQIYAKSYLLDYEYADNSTGIGDVQMWFDQAPLQNYDNPTCGWDVACRYGQVDAEAVQMLTNLRASQQNLSDKTAASQPHQTDLALMQDYGFMTGQVTIVSLREQVARAYQDGKLVYWSYIATGRPELPTPPGIMYTTSKQTHIIFKPLGPPGPINGFPTPINFAVNFTSPFWNQFDGYFLHDAWWRVQFGPGSNLPHYDPSAFNTGSHGCINFPLSNMGRYYDWVQVGTPVVIY